MKINYVYNLFTLSIYLKLRYIIICYFTLILFHIIRYITFHISNSISTFRITKHRLIPNLLS